MPGPKDAAADSAPVETGVAVAAAAAAGEDTAYVKQDRELIRMAMGIIAVAVGVLLFRTVPDNQLAVIASVLSGLLGTVVGGYSGYRFGLSQGASRTLANVSAAAAAAREEARR